LVRRGLTMGRIKTKMTKRISNQLITDHGREFTDKFDENKTKVTELTDLESKKLRNIIAGYVTRLVKGKEEL